ncbi:MAG: hypothetical protein DSZ06_01805 [Sulfurospirillum sp.]|nr:MAG: hypothetical protein DSZ06_01805 [Sulfurospirillum sp.]
MFKNYFFAILLFSTTLFGADDGIDLSINIKDIKSNTQIKELNPNSKFIIELSVLNKTKNDINNIQIDGNIPQEIKILKIEQSSGFSCKSGKNTLLCKRKSIKSTKTKSIKILAKLLQSKQKKIGMTLFLKGFLNKKEFDDANSFEIIIKDDKKSSDEKKAQFTIQPSSEKPKVGELVGFKLISKIDGIIKIKLDKNLQYINSKICKNIGSEIVCKAKKNKEVIFASRAKKAGLSISEFILIGKDKNISKEIVLEVQKDYIPKNLPITFKTDKNRVEASENYTYMIDINSSELKKSLKDIKLTLKTNSSSNFEMIKFDGKDWECKQSKYFVNCKLKSLSKGEHKSLKIQAKTPMDDTNIDVDLFLDISKQILSSSIEVVNLDFDTDNEASLQLFREFSTNGRVINIGDSALCYKGVGLSCKDQLSLAKSEVFFSKKGISSANLKLQKNEEIIFARVFWSGKIDRKRDPKMLENSKILNFKYKDDHNFHTFRVKPDDIYWKNFDDFFYYSASVDMLDYIKRYKSGIYEVSDLACSEGFGGDGAWRLVVITKELNGTNPNRKIEIYNGFEGVWKSKGLEASLNFKDRVNIALKGDKLNKFSIFTLCSDSNIDDRISLLDKNKNVYEKLDSLENSHIDDINIVDTDKNINNINISSLGDRFFISLVLAQE